MEANTDTTAIETERQSTKVSVYSVRIFVYTVVGRWLVPQHIAVVSPDEVSGRWKSQTKLRKSREATLELSKNPTEIARHVEASRFSVGSSHKAISELGDIWNQLSPRVT